MPKADLRRRSQCDDLDFRLLIGGEWVEAGDGTYEVVNPATEQVVGRGARTPPSPTPRRPARRPGRGVPGLVADHARAPRPRCSPGRRPARQAPRRARAARAGRDRRHHAGRQDDAGAARRRPASAATREVESNIVPLPPAVMPTTALAPGGIIGGVEHRAPVGVVACIAVLQLPAHQHGRQARPGAGHGQHRRGEAGAPGPARPSSACARCSRRPASRPAWSTSSSADRSEAGRGHRRLAATSTWSASPARPRVGCRIAEVAGTQHEAPAARAGRQGRGHRLRRRRPRRPSIANASSSVWTLPLRPDLHRAHPGRSPSAASTTSSVGKLAGMAAAPEGRRPARARHRLGPVITGAHRDRVEGYVRSGRRRGRHRRRRRRAPRPRHAASTSPRRCWPTPRTDMTAVQEEIFGPVDRGHPVRRRGRGHRHRQRHASSASTTTCSRGDTGRAMAVAKQLRRATSASTPLQRNHEAAVRRVQDQRRRPRRRLAGASTPTARCSRSSGRADASTDVDRRTETTGVETSEGRSCWTGDARGARRRRGARRPRPTRCGCASTPPACATAT